MPEPRPRGVGVCPRCYRVVTPSMARVLTKDSAYHRRCYLVLPPARPAVPPETGGPPRVHTRAPAWSDRVPPLLERLAQAVILLIVIGTALILLQHALP